MDPSLEPLSELITLLPAPYPPTIRVPRAHARRMIDLCEIAEVTPLPPTITGGAARGGNGRGSSDAEGGETSMTDEKNSENGGAGDTISPYVLVIEMALLLYVGEYSHARHLWRRCRRVGNHAVSAIKTKSDTTVEEMCYAQLESLWNAARYCFLWSNGGIYSLHSGMVGPKSGSSPLATETMKMEEDGAISSSDDLPLSTLALRALEQCCSSEMQPLSIYSRELIDVFRWKVNEEIHRSFSRIRWVEFCLRMNFNGPEAENKEDALDKYGWVVDDSVSSAESAADCNIKPCPEWEPHYPESYFSNAGDQKVNKDQYEYDMHRSNCHEDVISHHLLSHDDRIRRLTDVVMFMEQGRMNA